MNKLDIKASAIEAEISKGTKMEDIAKNLGISPNMLRKACKQFGINLRNKPRTSVNFIDDRVEEVKTETVDNTTGLTEPVKETFTESLLKKPKKEKKEEAVETVAVTTVETSTNSETNDLNIEL